MGSPAGAWEPDKNSKGGMRFAFPPYGLRAVPADYGEQAASPIANTWTTITTIRLLRRLRHDPSLFYKCLVCRRRGCAISCLGCLERLTMRALLKVFLALLAARPISSSAWAASGNAMIIFYQ
jgi:hypothetical protein